MFYEPIKQDHGLSKNPFNSLVIPRPIGWISSVDSKRVVNLAPYSFFNAVSYKPPTVMFSSGAGSHDDGLKDSLRNVESTGEFVCNLSTWATRDAMNQSSASVEPDVDELELSGLTALPSKLVKPPIVEEAPVHLEANTSAVWNFPTGVKKTVMWSSLERSLEFTLMISTSPRMKWLMSKP